MSGMKLLCDFGFFKTKTYEPEELRKSLKLLHTASNHGIFVIHSTNDVVFVLYFILPPMMLFANSANAQHSIYSFCNLENVTVICLKYGSIIIRIIFFRP